MEKKYKLLKKEMLVVNHPDYPSPGVFFDGKKEKAYHRIQALRDIPERGVKAGDMGGYVSNASILSQEGSCWIGQDAKVLGKVRIIEDSYVGDTASVTSPPRWCRGSSIVIGGHAEILDNAKVFIAKNNRVTYPEGPIYWSDPRAKTVITDNVIIRGNALLTNVSEVRGNSSISDNAKVAIGAIISGDSILKDDAVIQSDTSIHNVTVKDRAELACSEHFQDRIFEGNNVFSSTAKPVRLMTESTVSADATGHSAAAIAKSSGSGARVAVSTSATGTSSSAHASVSMSTGHTVVPTESIEINGDKKVSEDIYAETLEHYHDVKSQIDAYRTDITKIIQYPLMTDQTEPYTSTMTMALKKADRLFKAQRFSQLEEAVVDLETKFIAAESNAIKMASTMLSNEERKETATARKMLSMAANEASTEHEKKTAFTQAFKALEGVLTVPEVAKDTFRVKVGLKELEA